MEGWRDGERTVDKARRQNEEDTKTNPITRGQERKQNVVQLTKDKKEDREMRTKKKEN